MLWTYDSSNICIKTDKWGGGPHLRQTVAHFINVKGRSLQYMMPSNSTLMCSGYLWYKATRFMEQTSKKLTQLR